MAKFYGKVGFVTEQETAPSVWQEVWTERSYTGDVIKNSRKYEPGQGLNSNLNVSNRIAIVADAYANTNFFALRYIHWMGGVWQVTNVEVERPRLILTIGGVYNGESSKTGCTS